LPISDEAKAINLLMEHFPGSKIVKPGGEYYEFHPEQRWSPEGLGLSLEEIKEIIGSTGYEPPKRKKRKGPRGENLGDLF
jgi:hypothetical protein